MGCVVFHIPALTAPTQPYTHTHNLTHTHTEISKANEVTGNVPDLCFNCLSPVLSGSVFTSVHCFFQRGWGGTLLHSDVTIVSVTVKCVTL